MGVADRAFRQVVFLAGAVALPLALALALTLFPGAVQTALHGSDAFVQTCVAALYGLGQQLPPIGAVVLALALGAATAGAARTIGLVVRTHALWQSCAPLPLPRRLDSLAQRLGMRGRVVLFRAPATMAFTAGFVRPQVYLSSSAVSRLSDAELEAVLLHERAHLERGDPLRIAIVRLVASALFFVPLTEVLRARFEVAKELDADRAVIAAQRRVGPLAAALERLGRGSPLRTQDLAIGAWSCASARIGQLEGADAADLLPAPPAHAGRLSAFALAVLVALALGQGIRANIIPAAAWELSGAAVTASVHVCPLPLEGPLF